MNKRFIQDAITVEWDKDPLHSKSPPAPDRIIWNEDVFHIVEVLSEWKEFDRKGRMARNMRPEHLDRAAERGSWGVGEYYFQVRVAEDNRVFEIYYDRKPVDAHRPDSGWFLYTEVLT